MCFHFSFFLWKDRSRLLPAALFWWGPSSARAALNPWHRGCDWWRSRTSWCEAGGAWRTCACVWSSEMERRPAGLDPGAPIRSHYNLRERERKNNKRQKLKIKITNQELWTVFFSGLSCRVCFLIYTVKHLLISNSELVSKQRGTCTTSRKNVCLFMLFLFLMKIKRVNLKSK